MEHEGFVHQITMHKNNHPVVVPPEEQRQRRRHDHVANRQGRPRRRQAKHKDKTKQQQGQQQYSHSLNRKHRKTACGIRIGLVLVLVCTLMACLFLLFSNSRIWMENNNNNNNNHKLSSLWHSWNQMPHKKQQRSKATIGTDRAKKPGGSRSMKNKTKNNTNQQNDKQTKTMYSVARTDRLGAAVHDMLLAHAHAHRHDWIYGGACILPAVGAAATRRSIPIGHTTTFQRNQNQTQTILQQLFPFAYHHFLPFGACPPSKKKQRQEQQQQQAQQEQQQQQAMQLLDSHEKPNVQYKIVPPKAYLQHNAAAFTPEWRQFIQQEFIAPLVESKLQQFQYPPSLLEAPSNEKEQQDSRGPNNHENGNGHKKHDDNDKTNSMDWLVVVLHIRRGDVTPCRPSTAERYLPNSHYQRILQQYIFSTARRRRSTGAGVATANKFWIKIHSESISSVESWSDDQENLVPFWIFGKKKNKRNPTTTKQTTVVESYYHLPQESSTSSLDSANVLSKNHTTTINQVLPKNDSNTPRRHPITQTAFFHGPYYYHHHNKTQEQDSIMITVKLEIYLDHPLDQVWLDMITSDVLITSRSSFSFVPAVLQWDPTLVLQTQYLKNDSNSNNANNKSGKPYFSFRQRRRSNDPALPVPQVIYTPFWHDPLPHWTVVNDELLQQTNQELIELKQERCPPPPHEQSRSQT